MADTRSPARSRDAARSRAAILLAAEELFAGSGFDGATLQEIGERAGLSRGAPAYFFTNKETLYEAILDRLFVDRDAAVREAFAMLLAYIGDERTGSLEEALRVAVIGYLSFLLERPAFVRIVQWEALDDGRRLRASEVRSRAAEQAFAALCDVRASGGHERFDHRQAVVVFTSLCFMPVAYRATFLGALELDLGSARELRRHADLVVAALIDLIGD